MERYLFSSLGFLMSGSIGAFFLYVAMWPVIAVALVLMGLIVMFALGVHCGRNRSTGKAGEVEATHTEVTAAGIR